MFMLTTRNNLPESGIKVREPVSSRLVAALEYVCHIDRDPPGGKPPGAFSVTVCVVVKVISRVIVAVVRPAVVGGGS